MGQVELSENRNEDRLTVSGNLPGKLLDEYDKPVTFYPVDLSENGLGIVTEQELSIGDQLKLKMDDGVDVFLRVGWMSSHEDEDFFRCGLEAEDKKINFIELFDEADELVIESDD